MKRKERKEQRERYKEEGRVAEIDRGMQLVS